MPSLVPLSPSLFLKTTILKLASCGDPKPNDQQFSPKLQMKNTSPGPQLDRETDRPSDTFFYPSVLKVARM